MDLREQRQIPAAPRALRAPGREAPGPRPVPVPVDRPGRRRAQRRRVHPAEQHHVVPPPQDPRSRAGLLEQLHTRFVLGRDLGEDRPRGAPRDREGLSGREGALARRPGSGADHLPDGLVCIRLVFQRDARARDPRPQRASRRRQAFSRAQRQIEAPIDLAIGADPVGVAGDRDLPEDGGRPGVQDQLARVGPRLEADPVGGEVEPGARLFGLAGREPHGDLPPEGRGRRRETGTLPLEAKRQRLAPPQDGPGPGAAGARGALRLLGPGRERRCRALRRGDVDDGGGGRPARRTGHHREGEGQSREPGAGRHRHGTLACALAVAATYTRR